MTTPADADLIRYYSVMVSVRVEKCRICGSLDLTDVLDLGTQYLSGHFPQRDSILLTPRAPLSLSICSTENGGCGLVQLRDSVDPALSFNSNYGYESSLNKSMQVHLSNSVSKVLQMTGISQGIFVDIGSNDGTLLSSISDDFMLIGVDPIIANFPDSYNSGLVGIESFFPSAKLVDILAGRKVNVFSSFSMLYDLENPKSFVSEVSSLLDDDNGIWIFEQSYLPSMVEQVSFDTICHEHLEYYSITDISNLLSSAGMRIIYSEINEVNGGSVQIVATKNNSVYPKFNELDEVLLRKEGMQGVGTINYMLKFSKNVERAADKIRSDIANFNRTHEKVIGLGASTKGNVLLQYCGIDAKLISSIGEVNKRKFGCVTPGSWIEINDEDKLIKKGIKSVAVVLPWHFRESFKENPKYQPLDLYFPLGKELHHK